MKKVFENCGASLVIFAISMVTILGVAALVIDVGMTMYEKEKLTNGLDSAALASIQDIDKTDTDIVKTAKDYAQANNVNTSKLNISIGQDRKSVKLSSDKNVNFVFAKILGFSNGEVFSQSKAKVAPLTSFNGVRPLTIADQVFELNKLYTLKEDSGDGLSGNYGALALGGNGGSVYRDNLLYGYRKNLKVGDIVFTETGNITQYTRQGVSYLINQDLNSTYANFQKDSPRIIIMPIVNTLDLNGKKPITVVGFAAFYLEGLSGSGGNTDIVGRFVKYVAAGDSSDNQKDFGLMGIKLVN